MRTFSVLLKEKRVALILIVLMSITAAEGGRRDVCTALQGGWWRVNVLKLEEDLGTLGFHTNAHGNGSCCVSTHFIPWGQSTTAEST